MQKRAPLPIDATACGHYPQEAETPHSVLKGARTAVQERNEFRMATLMMSSCHPLASVAGRFLAGTPLDELLQDGLQDCGRDKSLISAAQILTLAAKVILA